MQSRLARALSIAVAVTIFAVFSLRSSTALSVSLLSVAILSFATLGRRGDAGGGDSRHWKLLRALREAPEPPRPPSRSLQFFGAFDAEQDINEPFLEKASNELAKLRDDAEDEALRRATRRSDFAQDLTTTANASMDVRRFLDKDCSLHRARCVEEPACREALHAYDSCDEEEACSDSDIERACDDHDECGKWRNCNKGIKHLEHTLLRRRRDSDVERDAVKRSKIARRDALKAKVQEMNTPQLLAEAARLGLQSDWRRHGDERSRLAQTAELANKIVKRRLKEEHKPDWSKYTELIGAEAALAAGPLRQGRSAQRLLRDERLRGQSNVRADDCHAHELDCKNGLSPHACAQAVACEDALRTYATVAREAQRAVDRLIYNIKQAGADPTKFETVFRDTQVAALEALDELDAAVEQQSGGYIPNLGLTARRRMRERLRNSEKAFERLLSRHR